MRLYGALHFLYINYIAFTLLPPVIIHSVAFFQHHFVSNFFVSNPAKTKFSNDRYNSLFNSLAMLLSLPFFIFSWFYVSYVIVSKCPLNYYCLLNGYLILFFCLCFWIFWLCILFFYFSVVNGKNLDHTYTDWHYAYNTTE